MSSTNKKQQKKVLSAKDQIKLIIKEHIDNLEDPNTIISSGAEGPIDTTQEREILKELQADIENLENTNFESLSKKVELIAHHLMDLGDIGAENAGSSLFQVAELLTKPNAIMYRTQLSNLIDDIIQELDVSNGSMEEQVGGMTPPSSSMEEAPGQPRPAYRGVAYGIDIKKLVKDLDKAAASYFVNDIWGDFDQEAMNIGFEDLKKMAMVRVALANAYNYQSVDKALDVYRKCDTGCRDKFPPLMWKLSENQWKESQNKRLGVPAR